MHLIFLTGLPRSGTTLLAEFISLHSEVHFNTNHGGTSIMEYVPYGAIPYGGSAECLSRMCVAYANKRHVDFARHNVSKYVSTNHSTIAIKDEAVMLNLKNFHGRFSVDTSTSTFLHFPIGKAGPMSTAWPAKISLR